MSTQASFFPTAPAVAPLITIARNLTAGFAPIELSGPIIAFDDAVQVATWHVRISAVPEPGSAALLGIERATLLPLAKRGVTRRARAKAKRVALRLRTTQPEIEDE